MNAHSDSTGSQSEAMFPALSLDMKRLESVNAFALYAVYEALTAGKQAFAGISDQPRCLTVDDRLNAAGELIDDIEKFFHRSLTKLTVFCASTNFDDPLEFAMSAWIQLLVEASYTDDLVSFTAFAAKLANEGEEVKAAANHRRAAS